MMHFVILPFLELLEVYVEKESTLLAKLVVWKLALFLKHFASVFMFRKVFLFESTAEDGFDFFESTCHAHILIQDLKSFHESHFSIFEFFISDGIWYISKIFLFYMNIVHFFDSTEHGMIFRWGTSDRTVLQFLSGAVIGVLYLHEIVQMLRVGFSL